MSQDAKDCKKKRVPAPPLKTDRLLAKSVFCDRCGVYEDPWTHGVLLTEHLRDVHAVANAVCEVQGPQMLSQLGLDVEAWMVPLKDALTQAAALHDLGKGNDRFQAMVKHLRGPLGMQPIRHEALSVYMLLHEDCLRDAFLQGKDLADDPIKLVVILAILGHHIKFYPRSAVLAAGVSSPGATGDIHLLLSHPDFQEVLGDVGLRFRGGNLKVTAQEVLAFLEEKTEELYDALLNSAEPFCEEGEPSSVFDHGWGRLLAAVKALLICCDGVGSAVPQNEPVHGEQAIADWVRGALQEVLEPGELDRVIATKLGNYGPREFQVELRDKDAGRRVVLAGCGSGKTLGAYMWASVHAVGKKLFFCYPTTGTATEGFGDYVMLPEFEGSKELIHGKSSLDLKYLQYSESGGGDAIEDLGLRLRGMESLSCKVTVCTADSVLGIMQNHRRGLYSSAAMMNASFVFDEVHAYDASMWSTLMDFIRLLPGANILLMSASLPEDRKQELAYVMGIEIDKLEVPGPEGLETVQRYELKTIQKDNEALKIAVEAASQGKYVLFVCNTVSRCKKYAEDVEGVRTHVYHSRFKYEDRIEHHSEVVTAFQQKSDDGGVIAFTTQVAEMSLDLDADVLVSEIAPIPSLIQRMGRLNRRAKEDNKEIRTCYVLELDSKSSAPYGDVDLDMSREWVKALQGRGLSQRDLSDEFNRLDSVGEALEDVGEISSLVGDPVYANRGKLRDGGYTGSFLMAEDCDEVFDKGIDRELLVKRTIPMTLPRGSDYHDWNASGFVIIAPKGAIHYDREKGAEWNNAVLKSRVKTGGR